jgi:hypothetical protein
MSRGTHSEAEINIALKQLEVGRKAEDVAHFADSSPTDPVLEERGRILRLPDMPPSINLLDQEAATH